MDAVKSSAVVDGSSVDTRRRSAGGLLDKYRMQQEQSAPEPIKIDYTATPTGRAFHKCDTKVRGVLGPIGSGKSSMCVWEIWLRARRQTPGPDRVRKTRWAVIRNCFDDKTEVLTEKRGWVLFKDLSNEDRVAIMGDNGEFLFEKPTYYYSAPYKGEMVCHKSEGVDFCVTPDHNLYLSGFYGRTKKPLPYEFVKAGSACGTHRQYRSIRTAEPVEKTDAPLSVDWFEFLGYWFAEGCAFITKENARRLCVTMVNDKDYAVDLLKRCGIGWNLNDGKNFMLHLKSVPDWVFDELLKSGKAITKRVPLWIKEAPKEHLLAFIKGHEIGDGAHAKTGVKVSLTSSKSLADDLQEMACRAGITANIRMSGPKPGHFYKGTFKINAQCYSVTFPNPSKFRPYLSKRGWSRENYDGMVYCVEVPGHRLLVRRNGVTHYSSQTYNELVSTTIKTFREWFKEPICTYRADKPLSARIKMPLNDGTTMDCEIIFLACDRVEDTGKFRSLELTGVWINEASEIQDVKIVDVLDGRTGRYPKKWKNAEGKKVGGPDWWGIIMDTNAPDDEHWWYHKAEVERPENWKFFYQPPAVLLAPGSTPDKPKYVPNEGQNPKIPEAENIDNIPVGWRYYIDQIPGKPYEYVKVFLMAQYGTVAYGKPVFPEYSDMVHYLPNKTDENGKMLDTVIYRGLPIRLGWDFGVRHSACVLAQLSPRGQLRVIEEILGVDIGVRTFARDVVVPKLKNFYPDMKVISRGDPAGRQRAASDESTCLDILRQEGIETLPCPTNSFKARRESVAYFLSKMIDGEPGFALGSKCPVLRKGFLGRYYFRKVTSSREEIYAGDPEKNEFSHSADALQYIATSILVGEQIVSGSKEIEEQERYPGVTSSFGDRALPGNIDARGCF